MIIKNIKNNNKIIRINMYRAGIIGYDFDSKQNIRILTVLQANGMWSFPKGHSEPSETLFQTAIREFKEETGYQGKIFDIFPIPIRIDNIYLYVARLDRHAKINIPKEFRNEILKIKWMTIKKLKTMENVNRTIKMFRVRQFLDILDIY